jgi:hypothetical protein
MRFSKSKVGVEPSGAWPKCSNTIQPGRSLQPAAWLSVGLALAAGELVSAGALVTTGVGVTAGDVLVACGDGEAVGGAGLDCYSNGQSTGSLESGA